MDTDTPTASTTRRRPGGPLKLAGECFELLLAGPAGLSVDGTAFPGLPARRIPLNVLRRRMLSGRCPRRTRDLIWAHLAGRARAEGAAWTVACVGMALPALVAVADYLADHLPTGSRFDRVELEAEVMTGFLTALSTLDLDRPGIAGRLRWAAYRAGRAALSAVLDGPTPGPDGFASAPPRPPSGHPDFVLAAAVRHRVITQAEADVIGTTRLEDIRLADWAAAHRLDPWAAYKMRARAEYRLVDYLTAAAATTDPDDPVATRVAASLATDRPPRRESHPGPRSRPVAGPVGEPVANSTQKSRPAVSKTGPKSGLLQWGASTPTTRIPRPTPAAAAQEASQCA
jgi:hypothetical protein